MAVTKDQSRDTGMAIVLVLLIAAMLSGRGSLVGWAIAVHVVNMTVPTIYWPAAVVWFRFAETVSTVMSKVVVSVVFFVVVTPIGLARRLLKVDSLQLKAFKTGRGSVMVERRHRFTGEDLEQLY